jgi:hypothetical protein
MVGSQISGLLSHNRKYSVHNFPRTNRFHTAKIYWALAEKTGATFDVMSQDNVTVAERPG